MPTTKTCICCGYTSEVPQEFKRGRFARNTPLGMEDDWVCKSEIKCMARSEYVGSDQGK